MLSHLSLAPPRWACYECGHLNKEGEIKVAGPVCPGTSFALRVCKDVRSSSLHKKVIFCAVLGVLSYSQPSHAIFRFCANLAAERMGRTPAGLLFEKAARVRTPGNEVLPYRFTHAFQGLRYLVKEETTGIQLYVRGGKVVIEFPLNSKRVLSREVSEDVVAESLGHISALTDTDAHEKLTRFMDQTVVPEVLSPIAGTLLKSLTEGSVKTDLHGSVALPMSSHWWPLRERGKLVGFHYEGVASKDFGRVLSSVGSGGNWTWVVAEVRFNRGRMENLVFWERTGQERVFNWAASLSHFFNEKYTAASQVVKWSNCLGTPAMYAGELTDAQRRALDVSPREISRAHLLGRDVNRNFEPLDLTGLPVFLRGQFRAGDQALVVAHARNATRGNGVSVPGEARVRFRDGYESVLSVSSMVPAIPHLISEGVDPLTMQQFEYPVGSRVSEIKTGVNYTVVDVLWEERVMDLPLMYLVVRPEKNELREEKPAERKLPADRFLPAHYYFPPHGPDEPKKF